MGRFATGIQGLSTEQVNSTQPSLGRFGSFNRYETHGAESTPSLEQLKVPVIQLCDEEAMRSTVGSPRIITFDQEELQASGARAAEVMYEGVFWSISEGDLYNPHLIEHGQEAMLAIELLANTAACRPDILKIYPNKGTGRLNVTTEYPTDQRYHLLPMAALLGFCKILEVSHQFDYSKSTRADFIWYALFSKLQPDELRRLLIDLNDEEYNQYSEFYRSFWDYAGDTFPHFQQEDLLEISKMIGFEPQMDNMATVRLYKSPQLVFKYTKEIWQGKHPNAKRYKNPYSARYTNVPVTCFMQHEALITTQTRAESKSFRMKHMKIAECGNKSCGKCSLRARCML